MNNNKTALLGLFLSLLFFSSLQAQGIRVQGKVYSQGLNRPLPGANVRLLHQNDSSLVYATSTDTGGVFVFINPRSGSYYLEATYVGFEKLKKSITVMDAQTNLGILTMTQSVVPVEGMSIEELSPRAIQKHDTTEYTAGAYKVHKDATTEELISKMPGVTVQNGSVTAQGETVQQVLVDGKQFFGSDPTIALRNIPSEVVDRIQVFDKMSDQAQFTGFEDGKSTKTMNIVTRTNKRYGQFGRFNAGYGTDDRYVVSGSLNNFNADSRFSVLALTNNINQQNFSMQDLFGVMGDGGPRGGGEPGSGGGRRMGGTPGGGGPGGGGSNFFVGQQSGTSTVHSLDTNYTDSLFSGLYFMGSYFFNLTDNENPQTTSRQYLTSTDSNTTYDEQSESERKNYNHRVNFRAEYTIDTANSLTFTPQINFQDYKTTSSLNGINTLLLSQSPSQILNSTLNDNGTNTDGHSSDTRLVYRHRFPVTGRTFSIDLNASENNKVVDGTQYSYNTYYTTSGTTIDTIDQRSHSLTKGYTLSTNLAYTEPVWTNTQLQLNYSPSYSRNTADKRVNRYDAMSSAYLFDTSLSNVAENTYRTHSGGLSVRYRNEGFNMSVGANYQIAGLHSDQSFPTSLTLSKTFYSILPNLMMNYELTRRKNIRFFYRASTASPSISQLQQVVDNTNELFLSAGNPDLKQSSSHSVMARGMFSGGENTTTMMMFLMYTYTNDYIANSTFIAQRDTILNDIALKQGAQLTRPVNLDKYWSLRSFYSYGFPITEISSNLNLNAGVTYSRTPGFLNNVENTSNGLILSPGIVLGSNVSEDVDFTLSYMANFNRTKNSARTSLDNSYYSHNAGARVNWQSWEGFVLRSDVNHTRYSGLSSSLDQNYWLWNISLGKKIFSNERGEITFSVSDILNQNKSISRRVTETYIEDTQTHPLQRYYLLTFSYNLRNFGGAGM